MNYYLLNYNNKKLHTLHTSSRQEYIHTCFYYIHRSYTKRASFNVVVYEPTFSKILHTHVVEMHETCIREKIQCMSPRRTMYQMYENCRKGGLVCGETAVNHPPSSRGKGDRHVPGSLPVLDGAGGLEVRSGSHPCRGLKTGGS